MHDSDLSGKRVAVLVEQQYQELEVWYPVYRLREAGAEVAIVAPEAGKSYPSKLGYPAKSELAAADASAEDFDAVVIPGGFAPDYIRRSSFMLDFVREMADQGRVVAAICHGPWVLCSTPTLRGRRATSFFAIKDDVINAGAEWVDEPVVRDGNIITSRTPDDLPMFLRAIMDAITELSAITMGRR
jgi:protease I